MTGIRHRFLTAAVGLAGALALSGCAYDDYGYGGVSVGTGYYGGGYGGGYYDPYYGPGYYQPGFYSGWYDGFYYPGSGYYVYDRGGVRHRWNDGQRRYWEGRRAERPDRGPDRTPGRRPGNWQNGNGRPNNGNWTRPRPPQDGNGNPGRWSGRWNGNNAAPQQPPAAREPQAQQPRPERNWGGRSMQMPRADRPMRGGGGRERARPN